MQRLGTWYLMTLIIDKIPHEETTVEYRYNAAHFITILHDTAMTAAEHKLRLETHIRHHIPSPNGRAMGCLLWGYSHDPL